MILLDGFPSCHYSLAGISILSRRLAIMCHLTFGNLTISSAFLLPSGRAADRASFPTANFPRLACHPERDEGSAFLFTPLQLLHSNPRPLCHPEPIRRGWVIEDSGSCRKGSQPIHSLANQNRATPNRELPQSTHRSRVPHPRGFVLCEGGSFLVLCDHPLCVLLHLC